MVKIEHHFNCKLKLLINRLTKKLNTAYLQIKILKNMTDITQRSQSTTVNVDFIRQAAYFLEFTLF